MSCCCTQQGRHRAGPVDIGGGLLGEGLHFLVGLELQRAQLPQRFVAEALATRLLSAYLYRAA